METKRSGTERGERGEGEEKEEKDDIEKVICIYVYAREEKRGLSLGPLSDRRLLRTSIARVLISIDCQSFSNQSHLAAIRKVSRGSRCGLLRLLSQSFLFIVATPAARLSTSGLI